MPMYWNQLVRTIKTTIKRRNTRNHKSSFWNIVHLNIFLTKITIRKLNFKSLKGKCFLLHFSLVNFFFFFSLNFIRSSFGHLVWLRLTKQTCSMCNWYEGEEQAKLRQTLFEGGACTSNTMLRRKGPGQEMLSCWCFMENAWSANEQPRNRHESRANQ